MCVGVWCVRLSLSTYTRAAALRAYGYTTAHSIQPHKLIGALHKNVPLQDKDVATINAKHDIVMSGLCASTRLTPQTIIVHQLDVRHRQQAGGGVAPHMP